MDTPVLDKLANQGARFDRFFVSPVCAPTRASLLTGRYHMRTGTTGVTLGYETMREDEVTLAEVFQQAGYTTGIFGKWHNGAHYPNHPLGQGFDEFYGFLGGHWHTYFDSPLEHNGYMCQYFSMPADQPTGETVQTEGYISDVLTDFAIDFIRKNRDRPFFCYVPYNAPHAPFQVPDSYFEKYKQRGFNDVDAAVYGMVENLDDNVGRLLGVLDELALNEDTVVIFMTDNGPNGDRYNGGMRGNKGSVHEGGVRVPFFLRWPGHIDEGQIIQEITAHIDLFPSLMELCDIQPSENKPLDGISFVPLINNPEPEWPDRQVHFHRIRRGNISDIPAAVRTKRWRTVNTGQGWELYDMLKEPAEQHDLALEFPEQVKSLSEEHAAWFQEVISAGVEAPPIPVGYPQSPLVELPAHESKFEGKFEWANWGTAHDWVTGWTSTDYVIWWDIEVVNFGRYNVTLLYTCPADSLGATVQVEAGGGKVQGKVTRAVPHAPHDRPGRDQTSNRVIKEFEPLSLGELSLDTGKTRLRVSALSKPGEIVVDLKGVRLRKMG